MTSHLATSEEEINEQAAADHKDEEPKDLRPKHEQISSMKEQAKSESL